MVFPEVLPVGQGVLVGVGTSVAVAVGLGVPVGTSVAVGVAVGRGVSVDVGMAVGDGVGENVGMEIGFGVYGDETGVVTCEVDAAIGDSGTDVGSGFPQPVTNSRAIVTTTTVL